MTENFNALFRGSCYFRLTLLAVSVSVAAFLTDSTASAQTGRHYDIYNQNYTFPVNQKFINVETSGNGGGVNARNSTVYLLDADFDGNAANFVVDPANGKTSDGLGGAIHSLNSELFLRDSVFTDNTAAGLGGAIYFKVENPADVPYGYNQLYSWTTQGYQTLFSGNKQKYDPQKPLSAQNNSITFAGQAGDDGYAYVLFSVDTDENAVLRQEDPMAIDPDSRGLYLYVEKFGAGTWQLGGVSDFTNYTNNTVSFYVQEGTLQFIENDISDNSGVKLYNYSPDISNYFMVYNADLEVAQGVNAAIDTNYFYAENGSRVKLLGNLNLFADVIYFDNSTVLTGSGNLTLITDLTNGGALYFFANTGDFSGNFTVGEGFFGVIPGTNAVFATSNFVVQKGGEIRLYSDIDLYAAQDGTNFGGVLTGSGDINVYASAFAASGTLHLVGNTKDYNGNFTIDSYVTLDLDMAGTFATNKTIAFMDDSALNIRMGKQEPQMKANEIIIGDDVNLSVYGIQQNTKDAYVVLQSNNVIVGTFANEGSSFDYSPADVDYLRTTLAKSNDGKQYLLTSILSWNLTDGTAHGNFTIEEDLTTGTPGKFTIDTALSPSPNRTLTKKGTGTLEIAAQNGNNIGNAVIEDGTLQLTHSQAIGSNKKIFFQP
ncbi:MAG: hypothetical protein FWE67_12995, partial [Planctomycetaceae bacterium]|nr:hypothetical protein [Planctomycetaceae bacterium]